MENKFRHWKKGGLVVASLLLVITMILSDTPVVRAEDNQSSTEETVTPNLVRYEGRSRENVAENVANAHFSDSNKVIIVNREKFPDAISATNISQGRYPVLYTREGSVSDSTLALLESMSLDEIYVLGGALSINDSVVKQLEKDTNVKVTRIAGRSRYDANVSAINENFNQKDHVVIASGEVYSDALYGVSYANTIDAPVILTKTNQLEGSTIELLKDLEVKQATIIGGNLTVTQDVEDQLNDLGIKNTRIAGRNRYIGSAEVASASYQNPENVVIASGEVFSDALISAPLAQKLDAPILLVRNNRTEEIVEDYLIGSKLSLENIYIQGGPLTISKDNEEKIKDLSSYLAISNKIPFETETVEDEELFEGQMEVVQEGINGVEKVYYTIVSKNGVETDRIEIDREMIAPTKEIVATGTKVNLEEAQSVVEMIEALPDDLTLEQKELVSNARNAYETLTSNQKAAVNNLERLENAEAQITRLENTYTLTVKVSPLEGGTISGVGEYEVGTEVQLGAELHEGFTFENWTVNGEVVSEEAQFTYAMPAGDSEVTANFQSVSEPYLSFNSYSGTITGYDIAGGRDVIIPSSIDGVEVRYIGSNAFENKNITSVSLPDTIIGIRSFAFRDNLISQIDLPNSLTFIGGFAFNNNLLTSLNIPENVTEIDNYAFNKNNLSTIFVPDTVKRIGRNAFSNNYLTSVRLPNGIENIESYAFASNNLVTVSIPNSVSRIESSAFQRNELSTLEVPSNVETIGVSAFANNDLEEVIFNEGLLRIENSAFVYNKLREISFPNSLVSLGDRVFGDWTNRSTIEQVKIGEGVFIGENLFQLNNTFREAYSDESNGGTGTYIRSDDDEWLKQ